MREPILIDALVVGGGAAGLFALRELRRAGASVLLVEKHALGLGQTTASQGILHAGVKYALGGLAGDDAVEASAAAQLWEGMLADKEDLGAVRVLTRQCMLWRTSGFSGAAGLLGAKLALRTRPIPVESSVRPAWVGGVQGEVLSLGELVIDPISLLEELARPHAETLLHGAVAGITQNPDHVEVEIQGSPGIRVRARHLILTAGLGNQEMLGLAHLSGPPMQQRPLRQALIRGDLPMVFGHCIDGAKTRITVTSATTERTSGGEIGARVVWNVGGQIAEDGPGMSPDQFRHHAMEEISRCLPAVSFAGCAFASHDVARAEPHTRDGRRPPKAFTSTTGRITTIWPVKLVLAPLAAQSIVANLLPSVHAQTRWPEPLPRPPLAARPWDHAQWSELP
ncbi:MAG: FAD-binding oxidoreductase [Planctomycetes bacterium]|nr:FAD-binding oxidoreductase [Planctomycetota bacterium]